MVLIDTGPLVALSDARDTLHRKAVKDLAALQKSRFVICEAVIVEACFHLPLPSQRLRLQQILERLDFMPVPAEDLSPWWKEIFDWLARYGDHEPDWTDGCLSVLCSRDRKLKLWTYDSEFRTIWKRLDGSPIPLASRL
jgi:predicted nucleic acid-binding protein